MLSIRQRLFATLFVLCLFAPAERASAGCGCDHPPPIRGVVYPRFAWMGSEIEVYSEKTVFPGAWLKISGQTVLQYLPPQAPNTLRAIVPPGCSVGPAKIEVFSDAGQLHETISETEFTVLPRPLPLFEEQATYYYEQVVGAVTDDGTLLIPFDLAGVIQPMQFFVALKNLAFRFNADELIYYNKDQYNMKLFQYMVSGPEDYQWGAYYGSTLEESTNPGQTSDVIGYWRHEFERYTLAHLPGGQFEAGPDGRHPDGSLHVDHVNLILAIRGWVSDSSDPYKQSKWKRLSPGLVNVDVDIRQLLVDAPVTQAQLTSKQKKDLTKMYLVKTDPQKGLIEVKVK